MSLLVWLPLNGNLENQGASKYQFINRNVTFSNDGKIGQCAEFNGSNACIYTDDFSLGNEWSYSLWFYDYTREVDWTIIVMLNETGGNADTQFSFWYHNNSSWMQSTANTQYNSRITAPTKDTWHHFCATFNGSTLLTYIDGSLVNTKAITTAHTPKTHLSIGARRSGASSWSSYWKGKINDFRVYNHCLSVAEVHEISQGLVLHYKLDSGGTLCKTDLTSWSKESGVTSASQSDGSVKIDCTAKTSSRWGIYCDIQNILPNTQYTFTVECKTANSAKPFQLSVGTNPVPSGTSQFGTNRATMNSPSGFTKYTATVTTNTDTTWIRFYLACSCSSTNPEYQYAFVKNVNMTIGSAINTTIQDSSGYGHNGTIGGAPTLGTSEGRYNAQTNFTANNQYIQCNSLITSGFGNSYTFAWWGKKSTAGNMFWGFQNGIRLNGLCSNNLWNTGDSSNNPLYKPGTTTAYTVNASQYHHYAMTGNGTKCYVYVDGSLVAEAKTYKSISGTNLFINGWDSGTSYSGVMSMSDFRIYCTALSAADIKQLYEIGAKVDNLGNWHTFEFTENSSIAKVKKTGITQANEVHDNLLFRNKAQIIKNNAQVLIQGDLNIITTKSGHTKTGGIPSLPAATVQSLAGKTIRLVYDVCAPGVRNSTEQGQTAYNYTRYGIHGGCTMDGSASYPFAGELNYSGNSKHTIQTWTIPTGKSSYGALSFSIQNFDKPASTNNDIWFITNVRLELIEGIAEDVTGTNLIEL